jgi:hypothetical protein
VEDLLRHEREAMARATEERRRSYDRVATQDVSAESRRGATGDSTTDRHGWMSVGYYNDGTESEASRGPDVGRERVAAEPCGAALQPGRWLISYLGVPLDAPPATLVGRRVKSTNPLHLRHARPDELGNFDKRSSGRVLPRDTTVSIEDLVPWNDSGFYFAMVEVLGDPPG